MRLKKRASGMKDCCRRSSKWRNRPAVAHWRRRATIWDAKSGNCCMAHDDVHTVFSSGLARIKKPEKRSSEFSAFATPLAAASRQTKSKRGNKEGLKSKCKDGISLSAMDIPER